MTTGSRTARRRSVRARGGALLLAVACGMAALPLHAQVLLDRVLFKFGSEIVTLLDVRQARMLKLVDVPQDTDQAYIDAIVNRRLMLAEIHRTGAAEPTDQAVDTRYADWQRRVGAANLPELLQQAGISEAGVRAWLHDGVRLQMYLDDRFAGRQSDIALWLATLRQRAGIR